MSTAEQRDALWFWAAVRGFERLQFTRWQAVMAGIRAWRKFVNYAGAPDIARCWAYVAAELRTAREQETMDVDQQTRFSITRAA